MPEAFITNNSLVLESTELLTFSYLKGFMTRADLTPYVTGSAQPQVTIDNLKISKFLCLLNRWSRTMRHLLA